MCRIEIVFTIIILLIDIRRNLCAIDEITVKYEEGRLAATNTYYDFYNMFFSCISTTMPEQHLLMDDLKHYVNYPAKTTVGFAPKFTNNRKFFANMISSPAFKEMLARDEEELRKDMIKKIKYCNEVVMDPNILKEFYDREPDSTKF